MKILFISDIHANYEALFSLESYMNSADITICLGDVVGYYCSVNEVINFLINHEVKCIQGNHDRYLLEGFIDQTKKINDSVRFGIRQAKHVITAENYKWIRSLPISFGLDFDNVSILCCHGSPWDPLNEYLYADSLPLVKMLDFKYKIIALGHTHRQYIMHNKNQIIVNPGSVGQSRDYEGKVCAKILDTNSMLFKNIYLDYDYQKTISYSLSCGASNWIYKHFQTVI